MDQELALTTARGQIRRLQAQVQYLRDFARLEIHRQMRYQSPEAIERKMAILDQTIQQVGEGKTVYLILQEP